MASGHRRSTHAAETTSKSHRFQRSLATATAAAAAGGGGAVVVERRRSIGVVCHQPTERPTGAGHVHGAPALAVITDE